MKVQLWVIGKTAFKYLEEGMSIYEKRLKKYVNYEIKIFDDVKNAKNMPPETLKSKEADKFIADLKSDDYVILLDETGANPDSIRLAHWLENTLVTQRSRLIFIIGGAWGFDSQMYQRANYKLSLSKMTFSHQLVRLLFLEQLYRAFSIINQEPYHK